jgi:hypothetical protein
MKVDSPWMRMDHLLTQRLARAREIATYCVERIDLEHLSAKWSPLSCDDIVVMPLAATILEASGWPAELGHKLPEPGQPDTVDGYFIEISVPDSVGERYEKALADWRASLGMAK